MAEATVTVTVRVPPELYGRLLEKVRREGISVNTSVVRAIEKAVA